jgi:hypothetical protein
MFIIMFIFMFMFIFMIMIMIIVSFQSKSTVLTLQRRLKVVIPGQRGLVWPEDRGILGQWSIGKAGSGKLTLMRFTIKNQLTGKHLKHWGNEKAAISWGVLFLAQWNKNAAVSNRAIPLPII